MGAEFWYYSLHVCCVLYQIIEMFILPTSFQLSEMSRHFLIVKCRALFLGKISGYIGGSRANVRGESVGRGGGVELPEPSPLSTFYPNGCESK